MGLTVIPAFASGNLPPHGAAASGGSEGIAGDFAALLSGEILGLMGAAPDASGLPVGQSAGDASASPTGAIDPALLTSLFGQGSQQAVPHELHRELGKAADDNHPVLASALLGRQRAEANLDDQSLVQSRGKASEIAGGLDKPAAFNLAATALARPAAANIAAESQGSDGLPAVAAGFASQVAASPSDSGQHNQQRNNVSAHLHSAAWPQQFGDKVVWMAKNDQQSAQLTINPPQLGPIQITLNLSGDQASIAFASPHAEVRQAIESAMPQLKDMLSSAGINLGQSNVGANLSQQRQDNPLGDTNGTRSADENAILPANDKAANAAGNAVLHRGRGLVDLFA